MSSVDRGPIEGFASVETVDATRPDRLDRVPWGAVALYVAVSFGLAWLVAIPLWLHRDAEPTLLQLLTTLTGTVMMFTPAIAVLAVLFLAKTPGRGRRIRFLGIWPLRPAKRVVWFMVAMILVPIAVVLAALALSAAFGWIRLDLVHFSGFAAALDASLPSGSASAGLPSVQVLVLIQLIAIPFGAVFNALPAFGEEVGWRGWLLPALLPMGTWPALLVSGAIWGLWHSPLILLGYNFGLTDWRGVALMTGGCVCWGVLFGWARLRSASLWPAVLGHGALNAAAGLFGVVAAAGEPPTAALVNPLGVSGWIVLAVGAVGLLLAGQFGRGKQPELAPPRTWAPSTGAL